MLARPVAPYTLAFRTARGRPVGFCFLKDQQPVASVALNRAAELARQLCSIIASRPAFLERAQRDPEPYLPRSTVGHDDPFGDASRLIRSGDPTVVANLRLFAQIASGYPLITIGPLDDPPVPAVLLADADDRLAALAADVDEVVDRYIDTMYHLPEALHLSLPARLGEVGWVFNGKIINHAAQADLERMALLAESGKLWELRNRGPREPAPRILEISSGAGSLAYHLKRLVPRARYYCVDTPETLALSAIYLMTLFPDERNVLIRPDALGGLGLNGPGFTFLPDFLFEDCVAARPKFDLIVNTLSMSNMTEKQVRQYCAGIARLLAPKGVFFEQNADNRYLGRLDARRVIGTCLPFCVPLSSAVRPAIYGAAHLWSVQVSAPYPWMESTAYLESVQAPLVPLAKVDELDHLRTRVKGMEASKFWKLRAAWFKCKRALGLAG